MLTLIRNARVYSPESLGICDVLVTATTIARVAPGIQIETDDIEFIDAGGRWLLPGFVDVLTHPCGGGGEGGFHNRTRELEASDFIHGGVTTPVGALGTDSITRNLEVLYGHVMKLRKQGLSALMYSGSYRVPATTLTGDIARDLILVEPVIGIGETAISDHRSSHPSIEEFRRLASDVHLGGTLSGKGGIFLLHVGDGESGLQLIEQVLADSDLPRRLFFPTHCNRHAALLEQAIQHAKNGGFADFTVSTTPELIESGEVPALAALRRAIEAGVPSGKLTLSSDAGGSLPYYEEGELKELREAKPRVLLDLLCAATRDSVEEPTDVIAALTRNPADALHLHSKGRIEEGADADLLLFDAEQGQLTDVFCLGRRLMRHGQIENLM